MIHKKSMLPLLTGLALTFACTAQLAAQSYIPGGNYRDTCREVNMRNGTLSGLCQRSDGSFVQTSLRNANTCQGNIINQNGTLICQAQSTQSLPQGTYRQSCSDIAMNGGVLTALCQRSNGTTVRATLSAANNCSGDISNRNGVLVCDGATNVNTPTGSYQDSCRDVRMTGTTLEALCRRSDGSYVQTSLANATNCTGGITNQNGSLVCGGSGAVVRPAGDYQNTCREIVVRGNRLSATCQRTNGSWTQSSIVYLPNTPVSNCDGSLVNGATCAGGQDELQNLINSGVNNILNSIFNN